jgi:SET domain-containing protein
MASQKKRNTSARKRAGVTAARKPLAAKKASKPDYTRSTLVEVRNSPIHGRGVYAVQPIKKGARIMEYVGERITHSEADRRFWKKGEDGHTFLFVVNHKTVIDGTHKGNDARYINHRCEANCETVTEDNRIFIDAIRNIKSGEELGYDYQLTWESTDDPVDLALYSCRCGSKTCRGTMLDKVPLDEYRRRARAKRKRAATRAEKAYQNVAARGKK